MQGSSVQGSLYSEKMSQMIENLVFSKLGKRFIYLQLILVNTLIASSIC